jgi:hypothetical protein
MRLVAALVALTLARGVAAAAEVTFPIVVDYPLLAAAVEHDLRLESDGTAVLWGQSGSCRYVALREIRLSPADGRVRLIARASARVGFGLLGFCVGPVLWDGYLETVATPEMRPRWRLGFQDLDSHIYDVDRRPTALTSRLWEVVKGRFEESFDDFTFDLAPPVEEARALLRASVDADRAATVLRLLETMRPVRVVAGDAGVEVRIAVDLPPAPPPRAPDAPEAPVTPAELERWQAALERWDGFLVFVVKDLGGIDADPAVRDDLLDLLLGSRHELLAALAAGPEVGEDPVRRLFVTVWERLRVIVRTAAARGQLEDRALRYLSFIAAGDALAAIDAAGPALGLEISADGLRRLARVLEPDYVGDPIAYSEEPDPALRELFHFHDPARTLPPPEPVPADGSSWWIGPAPAHAGTPPGEIGGLVRKLDRWVPSASELDTYRDAVGRILGAVAERIAAADGIDPRFRQLYADLVPTTAWQESCWRQFVQRNGEVTYLLSKSGDVGMMQVNRRVWRGFFDLAKLEWDVQYNAATGAEILAQLLIRYGSHEASGQFENAARATYAAYNGGPDAYRRYRLAKVPRAQRAIDRAFWDKFRAMAAGQALDFVLCVERWESRSRVRLSTAPLPSTPKCSMSSRSSSATVTMSSRQASIASLPRASLV